MAEPDPKPVVFGFPLLAPLSVLVIGLFWWCLAVGSAIVLIGILAMAVESAGGPSMSVLVTLSAIVISIAGAVLVARAVLKTWRRYGYPESDD